MINLNIKINEKLEKIELNEELLFNVVLCENVSLIKKLIKMIHPTYKIDTHQFKIVNKYIELDKDLTALYPGLIVKVKYDTYAILYLEGGVINEEYMISIIKNFIYDTCENSPKQINIDMFEITMSDYLNVLKSIKE